MKSFVKTTTTVTLVLNPDEVEWLKALMQNPLGPSEQVDDRRMREKFWDALQSVEASDAKA